MSAQTVSFSLSKPIDIYTDKYIKSVPYLNMVHTLLSGVGDSVEVDSNGFIGNTFRTMQFIVNQTNIDLPIQQLAVIYNKTIRMKGQPDSVYYFFIALGITVEITYNPVDSTVMLAIIDFGDVRVQDVVAFEIGYTQLINELLFFGQGDFMYDHLEIFYNFNKTVNTEISAGYTNMITISPRHIHRAISNTILTI